MMDNDFIAGKIKTIESGFGFIEGCISFDSRKVVILEVIDQVYFLAKALGNEEIAENCFKFQFLRKYEDLDTIEGRFSAFKDLKSKYETLLDEFTKGGN